MLESIVLLWIAVKLQAPLWVYIIVILMLVTGTLSFIVDIIDKVEKKQIERRRKQAGMSEEAYAEFKRWAEEQQKREDK